MIIFKYPIMVWERQTIMMPEFAQILTVQMQGSQAQLWVLVDESLPKVMRVITTYGTGMPIESTTPRKYVGTYQAGGFVFHVFDEPEAGE